MRSILKTALIFLILLLALPLAASADGGKPISAKVDYTAESDVTGLMQRVTALLTSPDWFGSDKTLAPMIKAYLDSGKLNLTGCQETLHMDNDAVRYTMATHYAGLAPDSFKGKLYALPNHPLASAQYVSNDALIYLGLNNVSQSALIIFHWLVAHPETLEKGPLSDAISKAFSEQLGGQKITGDELQQASGMLDATGAENQINALLTGEVAAAVYDADVQKLSGSNSKPTDVDAVVFLGVKDSAGVEKLLTSMGGDAGIKANGEKDGWKLFTIADQPSMGLALNGNLLVGATQFDKFTARLMAKPAMLSTPDCQYYLRFNLQRLVHDYAEPLATDAAKNGLNLDDLKRQLDAKGYPSAEKMDAAWRYVLDFDNIGDLGALTMSGSYDNGCRCEVSLKPAVFMYGAYQLGRLGGVGLLQDATKEKAEQTATLDAPSGGGGNTYSDVAEPAPAEAAIVPGSGDELQQARPAGK